MSGYEYKMVLRARLPRITSDREHYELFRDVCGEPDEVDEFEDDIYFAYNCPVDGFRPCSTRDEYGVELVLYWDSAIDRRPCGKKTYTFKELKKAKKELCKRFGADPKDVILTSYSWYNGGDEPVDFS